MSLDWIEEGAEVVVYQDSATAPAHPHVTTIRRVNPKSFTLTSGPWLKLRFPRDTARVFDRYSAIEVVPVGSEKGVSLLHAKTLDELRYRAHAAAASCTQGPANKTLIDAAIEALQDYRDNIDRD